MINIMTLDETIKMLEDNYKMTCESLEDIRELFPNDYDEHEGYIETALEEKQRADWLKELKKYREKYGPI